ncbi:hypothetical protein BJ878DRAFT_538411 [Calycina marina]|uniref:Uncharacterized protein n=1 Tax=Calycina marina TaxID=1763456 RepID=A0A9P8CIH0_9HELO|nr:hypothetical protein BJ878DRAFT_538411 [Calycina marina]
MNSSVTFPANVQNNWDPNLICTPPQCTGYFIFFATNYIARAATLITHPGESIIETLTATANALFITSAGALRVFLFLILYLRTRFAGMGGHRTNPEQVARAGAPCMVVDGETFSEELLITPSTGQAFFAGSDSDSSKSYISYEGLDEDITLTKNYNIPRLLVTILQVGWRSVTLYHTRVNQIALYGYDAFGLSRTPRDHEHHRTHNEPSASRIRDHGPHAIAGDGCGGAPSWGLPRDGDFTGALIEKDTMTYFLLSMVVHLIVAGLPIALFGGFA